MSHDKDTLVSLWQTLDAHCRASDYAGWDPFDALNSRLFRITPFNRSALCRLAWLQLFKRCPVNFRPLAGIPKAHNAKALSLFARSYLAQGDKESAARLLEKMLALRSDEAAWGKGAWGYPFDWQAKAFFVPRGTPNVITTTYCILALDAFPDGGHGELFRGAAEFILTHLACRDERGREYVTYIPGENTVVHNANLWGCYVLARASARTGEKRYRDAAKPCVEFTLRAQNEDGSWAYGELPHHRFIDGFHTGYNLEALHRMQPHFPDLPIAQAIQKGMAFYVRECFLQDGTAKYYANGVYPLDAHSFAQGILTCRLIAPEETRELQDRIMAQAVRHLWLPRAGRFAYQRRKHYLNRLDYLRWTQAWMHLALSALSGEKTL